MNGRFAGRVALVTGGSGGIGGALVDQLRAEGAIVVVADLAADDPTDVTDPGSVRDRIAHTVRDHGRLDHVFVTSGTLRTGRVEDMSIDDFDLVMRVNLRGAFLAAKYAIPHLRASRGTIVFTGSTSSLVGSRDQAAYCAAKAGVANLTRALADELAADGIRVNCVCPGWVDTPFNRPFWDGLTDDPHAKERLLATVPLRRQAAPDEIAPTMLFLASNDAAYVTGEILVVDGGLVAVR